MVSAGASHRFDEVPLFREALLPEVLDDRGSEFFRNLFVELLIRPANAKSFFVVGLGDDVEVNVKNGLVCRRAIVLQDIVVLAARRPRHRATKPWKHAPDRRGAFVRKFAECGFGFLRNDEGMTGAQRTDIQESEHVLVLIESMAGDFAG